MTTYNTLVTSITELQAAETVTKKLLGSLSRSLLKFVIETGDVRPVNMLLGNGENGKPVLTPMNFKVASKYFHAFLPFVSNWNEASEYIDKSTGKRIALKFGSKNKKKFEQQSVVVAEWLEVRTNNIWVWADDNIQLEKKPVDWRKMLTNACTNAQEKGDLNIKDVLECVCASGIELTDLLLTIEVNKDVIGAEVEPNF